ncbi:MAG TPA: ABC transporter substrate-binding protein [Dehalococcoidia bacterium]|nr:ABC transporter substrate-binding protein [Dehalococcoidia bacterium]
MFHSSRKPGFYLLTPLLLCLFLLVACGSSATTDTAAQPAAQSAATTPPQATAVPAAKPAATAAPAAMKVKPAGALTVGQKELGTFQGHPALAVNPSLFVQQTAPISEGLVTINIDKKVEGWLAESWSISDDFLTWTFKLKKGVQFHKGYGEMTAADVIYSYQEGWGLNKLHARTPDFKGFWTAEGGSVTQVDDYTIDVNTGIPVSELVTLENWLAKTPSGSSNWVVSKSQSDEIGVEAANRDISGTGPWSMEEHHDNEFWRMAAVEDHWRQTPAFAELIFREIPEESSRIAGFQTGTLDTFLMAFDSIPEVEKVEGAKLLSVSNAIDYAINLYGGYYTEASKPDTENRASYDPEVPWISSNWHTDSPEWENARKLREALAISIDRDTIIETLLRGFADPIKLWFWGNHGSQIDGDWEYNPERAKQLLAEAGYPDGFSITLTPSLRGAPAEVEACSAVAQMWGDIGIDVKLQSLPYSTLRPTMVARTYQGATCHAAGARIVTVGAQTLITENAAWNAGASHPWMEEIMPRISAAVDPNDLVKLESELGNWLFDNALTYIGLYSVGAVWPVGPRIEEWKADIKFTDLRNINGYEYIKPR